MTWLGSGQPRNHGLIPNRAEIIFISKTWKLAWRPTQPHSLVTGVLSWWWWSNRFTKLTNHLHQNIQVLNEQKEQNMSFTSFFPLWRSSRLVVEVSRSTAFRHTTLGRIPLDEGSARRRDHYLTTPNIHKRQTCMPPAGFEPAVPASDRPQTHFRIIYGIYYYL